MFLQSKRLRLVTIWHAGHDILNGMPLNTGGRRRYLALLLSLAVSVVILVFLAWRLDWAVLVSQFDQVYWGFVPLLVLVILLTFWVRALRWRHLLASGDSVSRWNLCEATLVGFTATFILPLRAGEIIRPLVLSRWQQVRFSSVFASIVVERAFDALMLMVLLGVTITQMESVPPLVSVGATVVSILALVVFAMMVVAFLGAAKLIQVCEKAIEFLLGRKFPRIARKLTAMTEDFLNGLRGISSARNLVWSVIWSVVLWTLLMMLYQIGLWTFGIESSIWVGAMLCVMIALAVAAPGAPGFVGTFQLGCVVALVMYGYTEEFAIAYSIVLHALQVITVVVCGLYILNRRGLRLSEIRNETRQD